MSVQEIILWAVALLVAVIFGMFGFRNYRNRKSQVQKTLSKSVSIQSGRDTKINDDK